ncbi:GvpL/GvpF family gas vesicle protein [Streptomyces sp. NPDC048508]|uniref:GvpL/GvpF family gas vesicle protein n=1 Tax=Streptomyces sp. NPDC048508 TaxID=3365561 RepID=UPI00371546B0
MPEPVTYAYAVARAHHELAPALAGLTGVAGASVRAVSSDVDDGVVLAVSSVPAADFEESGLRRHLEDLDWLETVARAHHTVVEAVAAHTAVLPLRLATVYLDDTRARDVLHAEGRLFAERLDYLTDQVEWGVKIYVEATAPATPEPAPATDLTPGRAYLHARKRQRSDREAVYDTAQQVADRLRDVAQTHASERVGHRTQTGALAEGTGENVLNDSFLIPKDRGEAFRAEAASAAQGLPGIRVEVTGPWAPYSFAMPEDPAEAARGTAP